ncbi:MAG TPA: hypothetical protein VH743_12905 [Beijerinckiaceae bacterium]|jgi:hypothetical protein
MLLAACEGRHWCYEICEHTDGYLVQMRDLETGDLNEEFATIFRTMPVAFAYAEMSAAFDRFAAAEMEDIDEDDFALDVVLQERNFIDLSDKLGDTGLNSLTLKAWERASHNGPRRVCH